MIDFIDARNEVQLQFVADFKIKLMDEINTIALKLGFIDKSLQNYDTGQALKNIETRDNFLISYKGDYIGYFQVSIRESLCEQKQVVYLHGIYIEKIFRNLGIGQNSIDFISTLYKKPIECDCWYGMGSLHFFDRLGFRKIRMTFYSDQNCMSENKK